jgi:hypothetical protein
VFHTRPLTDPDVIVSGHPARATLRKLPPSATPVGLLPLPIGPGGEVEWPGPLAPRAFPRFHATTAHSAPSPAHRYFRPRGSAAWAFSLGSPGQVLPFRPEAQAGVMSPLRRTPPGQSTGPRQARPRAYLRLWFWRHRCPIDASSGIRLRSSLQSPPDGCSRLFHDAHDRGC